MEYGLFFAPGIKWYHHLRATTNRMSNGLVVQKKSRKRGFTIFLPFPIIALSKPGMADNTNIGVIMSLLNESIAP